MITLNTDRGLVTAESWNEVTEIDGFTTSLDPKLHKLKAIIGRYIFPEEINCGLSNCNQPHLRGYVVSTEEGPVTNIGNGCGKKHFGVDFETQSKNFDRAIIERDNREAVASFMFRFEDYTAALDALLSSARGANWVHKWVGFLKTRNRGCPDEVVTLLGNMIRQRDPDIFTSVKATDDEIDALEASLGRTVPRPHYNQVKIGSLFGLPALYSENDLRDLLVVDLKTNLRALSEIDIDSATYETLRHWASWCREYDDKFERAQNILKHGINLLEKDNLEKIKPIIKDRGQAAEYRKFLSNLHQSQKHILA